MLTFSTFPFFNTGVEFKNELQKSANHHLRSDSALLNRNGPIIQLDENLKLLKPHNTMHVCHTTLFYVTPENIIKNNI